jgi:hypothetical protein
MIFSDIGAVVGVGLRRLQEWGRLLAPTVLLIGVAQSIYCFLHPAKIVKYSANMSHMIAPLQHQLPEQFQTMLYRGSSVF